MRIEVPPVGLQMRQDSTAFRPALLVAWLVTENDRLRVWIRELEAENTKLRAMARRRRTEALLTHSHSVRE